MSEPNPSEQGKSLWRSLEDRAGTPERREDAAREFPGFANVFEGLGEAEVEGGLDRRTFLALSAAGMALAGAAGCRRPELLVLPYARRPEDVTPGLPTYYATSIPRPGGGFPVIVESHEGRPTKVEGNPQHPASRGGTDVHAQASVLDLYSPQRSREVLFRGQPKTWAEFDQFAGKHFADLRKNEGKGLRILAEDVPSPALRLLRAHIAQALPQAVWHTYEPIDDANARTAAQEVLGGPKRITYRFDKAECVLALDADFLGCGPDSVANQRGFANKRRIPDSETGAEPSAMNRLYVVENTYTVTGTMADHRLRLPASQVADYAVALARLIAARAATDARGLRPDFPKEAGALAGAAQKALAKLPAAKLGVPNPWLRAVAEDLILHRGKGLIVAGYRQPPLVHALAHLLNEILGNNGTTVEFRPLPEEPKTASWRELIDALQNPKEGEAVQTLVILGGNPVYNGPADLDLAGLLEKVPTVIRLGGFYDETSERSTWHLPQAHYLESWGDAESADGTYCSVQPLIAPLDSHRSPTAPETRPAPRGGRTVLELLMLWSEYDETKTYHAAKTKVLDLIRKAFAQRGGKEDDPAAFRKFLHEGFLADSAPKPEPAKVNPAGLAKLAAEHAKRPAASLSAQSPEVSFHPSYALHDGRFAWNAWMLEWPDPITKLSWDNAALVSPKTAQELGVRTGDLLALERDGRSIEVPAFVLPGQADNSISLSLGWGKRGDGRGLRLANVADGGGFNVYPLRTSDALHFASGVKVTRTGARYELVTTQEHGTIPEGRDEIVHEVSFARHAEEAHGRPAPSPGHEHGPAKSEGEPARTEQHGKTHSDPKEGFQAGYPSHQEKVPGQRHPLDLAKPAPLDGAHQWGMVVDLNTCTGCSACVIACQSENNIPVVGKNEVRLNREMHWIRLDRYFITRLEATEREKGVAQTPEDNPRVVTQPMMCVHCEQAPCETVCPVNAAVHSPEGLNLQVYNRCIGTRYCSNNCPYKVRRFNWFDFNQRPLDQLRVPTPFSPKGMAETLKMQKNPDVTVRMRGVMEKCTYCIQRIERGEIGAKLRATAAAEGNLPVERDPGYTPPAGAGSAYPKPKDPRAAGYDLDAEGRVIVPDGTVTPACAQACPSRAIVFGNVADPRSRAFKLKQRQEDYLVLGELNTKPRTSYLPRLRNLNPAMKEATA